MDRRNICMGRLPGVCAPGECFRGLCAVVGSDISWHDDAAAVALELLQGQVSREEVWNRRSMLLQIPVTRLVWRRLSVLALLQASLPFPEHSEDLGAYCAKVMTLYRLARSLEAYSDGTLQRDLEFCAELPDADYRSLIAALPEVVRKAISGASHPSLR